MGRRILLVDDNADAIAVLAIALKRAGHEVREASDGRAALSEIHAFRPAIIFLDIGLPGFDGYEVARHIRRDPGLAAMRIIALTGRALEEDREKALAAGFDQYLVKPVDPKFIESLLGA